MKISIKKNENQKVTLQRVYHKEKMKGFVQQNERGSSYKPINRYLFSKLSGTFLYILILAIHHLFFKIKS